MSLRLELHVTEERDLVSSLVSPLTSLGDAVARVTVRRSAHAPAEALVAAAWRDEGFDF